MVPLPGWLFERSPPSSELWEFGRKRLRVCVCVSACTCMCKAHVCEPAKVHMCTRAVSIQMCTLHARVNLPVCTGACLCVCTCSFMCCHMHYIGGASPNTGSFCALRRFWRPQPCPCQPSSSPGDPPFRFQPSQRPSNHGAVKKPTGHWQVQVQGKKKILVGGSLPPGPAP